MRRLSAVLFLGLAMFLGGPLSLAGQESPDFLPVGEMAPDIEVIGVTRHGVLSQPVKLSDLKGETVVLAFFFRVRTGG